MADASVVLVTGANGFLGRHLCRVLSAQGATVRALVRNPALAGGVAAGGECRCDLPDVVDEAAFRGADVLVHCAYDTRNASGASVVDVNVASARRLKELCERYGVAQFVFISSLAAHPEAQSRYGRSKNVIEGMLDAARDAIVRPGTIIGDGGLFQRTREMVRRLPVLPLFYANGKRLQTVWIADLCAAIARIVSDRRSGSFVVADDGVPVAEFYRGLGLLDGRRPLLVPFPGDAALWSLMLLERFGVRAPITSENLLGVKFLRHFPAQESVRQLGVTVRAFRESLAELARSEHNDRALADILRNTAG